MLKRIILGATLVALAPVAPALADKPAPTENYGQCQGQNRHQLSAIPDWTDRALASIFAQLAPSEVQGPGIGDLLPDERPNARADINALLNSDLGCGGIQPGNN